MKILFAIPLLLAIGLCMFLYHWYDRIARYLKIAFYVALILIIVFEVYRSPTVPLRPIFIIPPTTNELATLINPCPSNSLVLLEKGIYWTRGNGNRPGDINPQPGVTIVGQGTNRTFIVWDESTTNVQIEGVLATHSDGVSFQNLTIRCNGNSSLIKKVNGIDIFANNCLVNGVTITGVFGNITNGQEGFGIFAAGSGNVVTNSTVASPGGHYQTGIAMNSGSNNLVINSLVIAGTNGGVMDDFNNADSSGCKWIGDTGIGGYGFYTDTGYVSNQVYQGCILSNTSTAFAFVNYGGVANVTAVSNTIYNAGNRAVVLFQPSNTNAVYSDVQFIGNDFNSAATQPSFVFGPTTDILLLGNSFPTNAVFQGTSSLWSGGNTSGNNFLIQ